MANSNEQTPAPTGANAGPQSGVEGAGGEPKGTRLQAPAHDRSAPDQEAETGRRSPEHSSDKDQPGYRARPAGHVMTMLGFRTDDPRSCGILELDDRGSVLAFHEKVSDPPGNLANGAVYVFEPEIIDAIAGVGRPVVDLSTEIIPPLVGRILCVETDGYHRDIGTPQSLSQARAEFAGRVRQPAVVSDGCR